MTTKFSLTMDAADPLALGDVRTQHRHTGKNTFRVMPQAQLL